MIRVFMAVCFPILGAGGMAWIVSRPYNRTD